MGPEDDAQVDGVIDGLDPERTARLLSVLRSGPEAIDQLQRSAEERLSIQRIANTLETGPLPPRLEQLGDQLADRLRKPRPRPMRMAASLAVIGIVGAFGFALGQVRDAPDQTYYGYETAEGRVLIEASDAEDVEVPADRSPSTLTRLSDWVGSPMEIPSLERAGFRFTGAKLLDAGGARVVGLVYRGEEGEVVLCLSRDQDGLREAPQFMRTERVEAGYWSDGQRTYALVRDGGRADARDLVAELRRATGPVA